VPRTPQRQRGRARVAALLAAAAAVFGEKGYEAATMTEIAARARASIGSLYQFFPTKDGLADAVHAATADALVETLDGLASDTRGLPTDALADRLFDGFFAFLRANPAFVALADRQGDKGKQRRRAAMRNRIADLLAGAKPAVPRREAEALAVVVLHLMKAAVAVSAEADLPHRGAVLDELRAMLRRRLARR
jgi:AcrR family transcriptional regulator